jgi:hypothetical protein
VDLRLYWALVRVGPADLSQIKAEFQTGDLALKVGIFAGVAVRLSAK